MGYSAAWRAGDLVASRRVSSTARNLSSKPGFEGWNGRKMSRSNPAASAARNNSSRRSMKAYAASWLGKSDVSTNQTKSSAVISRTSPSASVSGGRSLCAMLHLLTFVGFSQRNDTANVVSQGVGADMHPTIEGGIADHADFAIIVAAIDLFSAPLPIQPHRLAQRNPVFRQIGRVLCLIPLKLRARQPIPAMVSGALTGGLK